MANVFLQLLEDVGALPKKAADQYGQMQAEFNQAPIYQKMLPMSFAIKNMINQYSDQARQSRLNLDLIQGDLANRWQGRNQPGGWQRLMFEPPAENVMAAYNDILSQMFMTADLGKIKPGRLATPATKGVGGKYMPTTKVKQFGGVELKPEQTATQIGYQKSMDNVYTQSLVRAVPIEKLRPTEVGKGVRGGVLSEIKNPTEYFDQMGGFRQELFEPIEGRVSTGVGGKTIIEISEGHHRLAQLKKMGVKNVDVIVTKDLGPLSDLEARTGINPNDIGRTIINDKIKGQPNISQPQGLVGVGVKRYGR